MSGILDSRTRVIDALMTLEGRRQLARGDMRIEYYSFTDAGTYYRGDIDSGSADATVRLYFESSHLPQDQITFEADDSGRLKPFNNAEGIQIQDGQIVTHSFSATTSSLITGSTTTTFLKGEEFASTSETLLNESLSNFVKLQVISSKDRIFEDDGFGVGPNNVRFVVHNKRPIDDPNMYVAHVNHIESLFNDPRLSNVPNFAYLPPVNKIDDPGVDKSDYRATSQHQLGHYKPLGRTQLQPLDYQHIKHELGFYEDLGYCKTLTFDPTSKNNRLMIQVFEQGFNQLKKLDVIEFGQLRTDDQSMPVAHVFFIGKIFTDENDTHTFVHLFTLVFE